MNPGGPFRPLQASEKRPKAPEKAVFSRVFAPHGHPTGLASPARQAAFPRESSRPAFSAPDGHRPCRPVPRPAWPFGPDRPDRLGASAPRASRASASSRQALRRAGICAAALTAPALVLLLVFAFHAHCSSFAYQQLSLLSNAPHQSSARMVGNPLPVGGFFLHWQVSITTWHVSPSSSNRQ